MCMYMYFQFPLIHTTHEYISKALASYAHVILKGHYLHHLGVQSLPHLHASMSEQNRAIIVDMQQCSSLVQEHSCSECYRVLVWSDGQSSLLPPVRSAMESALLELSTRNNFVAMSYILYFSYIYI